MIEAAPGNRNCGGRVRICGSGFYGASRTRDEFLAPGTAGTPTETGAGDDLATKK
jgi:hypothetical protein